MAADKNMKVLIVDDQQSMRRVLRDLLNDFDFENIEEASDGATALEMLRSERFGLVISDWDMAPMTGIDLLREVRKDPELRELPFVMVTGESKTENKMMAKQAGVSQYIVKPVTAATLKPRLSRVIGAF